MRGMKSTELPLMHEAVRSRCRTPAQRNGSTDKMSFSVYFIIGSPLSRSLSWSLSTSQSLNTAKGWTLVRLECHLTTTTVRDHADEYLALNLPRFGDGRQVTGGHHHGPRNTTHANIISVYWYLPLRVCVFMPTWRSLCEWSPASCTWSSRSSSRRSWTGPQSSETSFSSCTEQKQGSNRFIYGDRVSYRWVCSVHPMLHLPTARLQEVILITHLFCG